MTTHRATAIATVVFAIGLVSSAPPRVAAQAPTTLPASLSDQEFWDLSAQLSEPNGYFRSDNLLSNEMGFQWVIPDLLARTKPGGVYLGVGPEQNFTYIAALKPKMVFITDIRRGNLWTQLMYKALFEMSADRSEFVSRLFTKPKQSFPPSATGKEIFNKYWDVTTSDEATYKKNSQDIIDWLTKKPHHIPLPVEDQKGIIDDVYYYFYWFGPLINYNSSSNSNGRAGNMASYYDLMTATDLAGASRAYIANDENFQVLKDLESKNLLVPVVGDFGGPKALRAVGQYVRDHGALVMAMYLSNVEQYLTQDGKWPTFCGNVASMPLDEHSMFIRSANNGGGYGGGGGLQSQLGSMQGDTQGCK